MPNNSSTGGYLAPTTPPAPLEGKSLNDFLQALVVGITGLAGDMVRPRWQPEPPNVPTAGDAWASIGVTSRKPDTYAYTYFDQGTETYKLQRQETLEVLVSFYDLGSNGLADLYAELWQDGLQVRQNIESLLPAGFAFVETQGAIAVPVILKGRWQYRVDVASTFRRQIDRAYPVLSIVEADGTLIANDGENTLTRNIIAKQGA